MAIYDYICIETLQYHFSLLVADILIPSPPLTPDVGGLGGWALTISAITFEKWYNGRCLIFAGEPLIGAD